MQTFEELFELAKKLSTAASTGDPSSIVSDLDALHNAAKQVERSFSGSWLGYHSRVYYDGFAPPPPGAHFSQEWGLGHRSYSSLGSRGDWREYDPEDVKNYINQLAKNPNLSTAHDAAGKAAVAFDHAKSEILSILENELDGRPDAFLTRLKSDLEKMEPMSKGDFAQHWCPSGQVITRDMIALGQKTKVPPHIDVLADITSIRHSFDICKAAADISAKAASHLERKMRTKIACWPGRSSQCSSRRMAMKHPVESDFDTSVTEAGVTVTFKPTSSIYSFYRLADTDDIARLGPVSPGHVRQDRPEIREITPPMRFKTWRCGLRQKLPLPFGRRRNRWTEAQAVRAGHAD